MYISTLSLTSVLNGGEPRPLYPGMETQYPLYRRLGGPRAGQAGGEGEDVENLAPRLGFDLQTVQPIASYFIN
jgi:hypothetical protein